MQLSDKITNPEDLLKVDDIIHSAFMKECENLFGLLSEDTFWKYREHLRSTYIYTPINIKGKPFHFIHLNKNNPNLIAFTSNDKIGKKDGKTYIKPGKYLAQYSDLNNEQIKTVVTNYKHEFVPPEIFYATSADDAARIYEEGPNSCMRGKGWSTENHPARIYFGPDTKLAYIKNKQGTGISSRSLIRVDKTPHEYIKIYGDVALMVKAFTSAGIEPASEGVKGCRFPLLWREDEKDKRLIIPYIDGENGNAIIPKNRKNREFMTIGEFPKNANTNDYYQLSSTSQAGYVQMPDVLSCRNCGELEFKEKTVDVDDIAYCEKCSEGLEVITVNRGNGEKKQVLLEYAEARLNSYFKINNLWYTLNGLIEIGKFYNSEKEEIIPLEDTARCYASDNRYLKDEMLIMNTIEYGTRYFKREYHHSSLIDKKYINPETYEFYSEELAAKLINEGNIIIKPVRDYLNETLEEFKANKTEETNYIPYLVEKMSTAKGVKEFLKLYIEHINNGSSYI